ncbi:MAG: VCBS repeat-containing protein [Chitinophagaceae bacterium]|nr:VCBS repeat-containing protein [Chitinophagaceae bacterium]
MDVRTNTGRLLSMLFIFLIGIYTPACRKTNSSDHSLFTVLDSSKTGITFANRLLPTPAFNLFSYMYYYNGAGVGVGDFNNDGLPDLFFAASQHPNALYLNKGQMKFDDVSLAAGIPRDSSWSTGVSVIDINRDGLLDIYVCKVGNYKILKGKNQLLVCDSIDKKGIPHYTERAADYGLDFSGFSTHAAFLDYDGDGDLDMFLLNHSVNHDGNYAPREVFENTFDSLAGQRLYRNDTRKEKDGSVSGKFTNVTREAGIKGTRIGYGLGVAVSDINLDGWPDIYVGNDFHENDYLYINQKNGSFRDENIQRLSHTSQFSMGVDVADINNDAHPDVVSMDMLPYDPYMLRRSLAEDDYTIFEQKIFYGYMYQYARNNLQLNRGNGTFGEIGQYAGIQATDWSWAALWMDFDNDGNKDLFVSNGIPKRMNDIDYINFVSGDDIQQKLRSNNIRDKDLSLTKKFPEIKIPNQFFRNTGNLRFDNYTDSIKNNLPTFSNGAAYADLDLDGDLDIVVNNIDDPGFIYANNTNTTKSKVASASITLRGSELNPLAIGARVLLYSQDQVASYEYQPVHGFQSSMLLPMHIGLNTKKIDSAILIWPDHRYQHIRVHTDKRDTFQYNSQLPLFNFERFHQDKKEQDWEDVTASTGFNYRHVENVFNEFNREPLMPAMMSTEGPAIAVADINRDGLEDIFCGASKGYPAAVYLQTAEGTFQKLPEPALAVDSMWEHVAAVWLDVNRDGNPDLLIATGGNEFYGNDEHQQPLL